MASALSYGAGAAGGLETLLERLMQEETVRQRQRAQEETGRSNLAREDIARSTAGETAALRQATLANTQAYREQQDQDRNERNVQSRVKLRPIGGDVTQQEYENEQKFGIPTANYNRETRVQGDDASPEVTTIKWRGTPEQVTARENAERERTQPKGDLKQDAAGNYIRVAPDNTVTRVTENGQPVKGFVQPDRTFIQTGDEQIPRPEAARRFREGQTVPLAEPAQVRTRQDLAERVGSHFDDIQGMLDEAEKRGLLGPLSGRTFNEFMAGKVGTTGNAQDDELLGELRQNLSLARSGLAQLHGRGGANVGIVQGLEKNMDAGFMDYKQLTGGLKGMKSWVDTYARKKSGTGGGATEKPPDIYDEYLKRTKKP